MTTCGVGGWGGPLPGDPSNVLTLTATAAFGGIDLTWVYPATNPYAVSYIRVFRGSSTDYASAVHLVDVTGTYHFDKLTTATMYYYWIQAVSINGTVLNVVGPASATSRLAAEETIEHLTGVIDRGLLATALKSELDQISILNANLASEIFDRETGETSLAEAMAAVELGLAEAHTFIIDETNTRVSETAAIAEQIDGVVTTLGGDIAAVTVAMTAEIDAVTGVVEAMIVTKLTVNDLVGGFGLYNDGVGVEAGFDVDRFWIGRTSADKRKPFIIDGGVVYLDEAVIREASITWAMIGDLEISTDGAIHSGQTAYDTGTGWWIGHVGGVPKISMGSPTKGFVWNGTSFDIRGDVVATPNLASEAVTVPRFASASSTLGLPGGGAWTSMLTTAALTLPSTTPGSVILTLSAGLTRAPDGGSGSFFSNSVRILRQTSGAASGTGTEIYNEASDFDGVLAITLQDVPGAGSWQYEVQGKGNGPLITNAGDTGYRTLLALGAKR